MCMSSNNFLHLFMLFLVGLLALPVVVTVVRSLIIKFAADNMGGWIH